MGRTVLLLASLALAVLFVGVSTLVMSEEPAQATFSGQNGKIAFVGGDGNIYTMRPDGSERRMITSNPAPDTKPDWSPDRTKIAFMSLRNGNMEIYSMNADGTDQRTLTTSPTYEHSPSWQALPATHLDFDGFFSPVDNYPTLNGTKAGSAIPVKFSLSGDHGLDIFAEGNPGSRQIACDSTSPIDSIEQTVSAAGSSLSYDAATNQYTYVWKTEKAWAGACRQFTMKLSDGTSHSANFKFK